MARAPKAHKEPRKHHYVPVFYQKHFSDASGLICVYDRKLRTYKTLPPSVVCVENDFYTIFSNDGNRVLTIETAFTKPLDALAATSLQKLTSRGTLDADDLSALAMFVGLQRGRVPPFRRVIGEMYKAGAEQIIRIGFSEVERAAQMMGNHEQHVGSKAAVTPESLVEFARSGNYTIAPTETAFLTHMVHQAERMSELVAGFEWRILEAPPNSGFVICDDPLVTVPPSNFLADGIGIANPGSVTYFPLTQRYCLKLERRGATVRFSKIGAFAVRQINKNIAANSDRFIMGPNMPQLKLVVETSGSAEIEPDRVRIDVAKSDADSALMRVGSYRRRYFYY